LASEVRTLVFYESPHRIAAVIADMAELFGAERVATIARELTKLHEEVHSAPLGTLPEWLRAQPHRDKGEFVIVVAGAATQQTQAEEGRRVLEILLADLPLKQAVALATRITGLGKNVLYEWALAWKGSARDHDS
jgi:16S rRNA (cytidine1402-2'-O)-methyltransferase